jgi:S-formylglutathione hydrolase FrmB
MKLSTKFLSIISIVFLIQTIGQDNTINAQRAPRTIDYKGTLMTVTINGPVSGDKITFDVLLPEDYTYSGEDFPVIYNLHGRGGAYNAIDREWFGEAIENAITEGILPPVICIFPDGTKSGWYADSKDSANLIETHIIREIIPWVDNNFNTKASKDFRVIQGFSMGGYGASLFAVKFPELFSICINYDGAMWTWESMTRGSERWPAVGPFMFNNDSVYYDQNSSPWTIAKSNRDNIVGQVQFRTVVGSLGSGLEKWRDHLISLGIEMDYIDTPCKHNLPCLHKEAGEDGFLLMAKQFKNHR